MNDRGKPYKLSVVMHVPSEETEDKYLAEIPALPGCRAWGDTAEDALDILRSVAAATIKVYQERGYKLPAGFEETSASTHTRELQVAV